MLRTRAPVATKLLLIRDAPRLACVKPIASVHPEPGSNSSLSIFFIVLDSVCLAPKMVLASDLLVYLYLSKGS